MSSLFTEIKSLFLNTVQKRTSNDSFTYKLTQLVDQSLEFDSVSISINSLFTIILTTFSHCHYTIALSFSNRSAIARTSMYFNMIIKTSKEWVSNIETATTERTTERAEKIIELVFVFVEIVKQIYFVNEKETLEITVNRQI